MFEAVIGNGGHWGLGAGLNLRANVWKNAENEDNRLSLHVTADAKYLFQNNETRTIGLNGKPGAQFARMRQQDPAADANVLANSIPGVNAMTQQLKVTPGFHAEGMIYADYSWNAWKFGVGYNIFGRQEEKVSLKNEWKEVYGLTGLLVEVGNNANGANYLNAVQPSGGNRQLTAAPISLVSTQFVLPTEISSGRAAGLAGAGANALQGGVHSASTIKANLPAAGTASDGLFIKASDLDLQKNQSAVSHKLAGQVSYALNTDNPSYLGLGGGYEFAGDNNLLSKWEIWAKFGISF